MILDMQQFTMLEGIISVPDYAFANLPAGASAIKGTDTILGNAAGTAIQLTGTVAQMTQPPPTPPFPGS